MTVRDATASDHEAIRDLLTRAFAGTTEADLVEMLRADGDVAVELVAADGEGIVGQVLLSKIDAPLAAHALAPLAVVPERQRSGIGGKLIGEAVRRATQLGADAMFVLGDPDYYRRFGFDLAAAAGFDSPYAGPHFMVLALNGDLPVQSGPLRHAPAFAALGQD